MFFNKIVIQTPESVELEFNLAGIGNRAYALLIDYIIWGIILIISLLAWAFVAVLINFSNNVFAKNASLWLVAIQFLIFFAIYVAYFVFFETIWQGQTPGKRFVKIRVISDNGRPIKLQQATLRALLRPFDDLFFIGALLIMLSKQEKRLGDLVAGTIVIQEDREVLAKKLTITEDAKVLAKQLQIQADIGRLLPEDFAVIREYLHRRSEMLNSARIELCRKLAYQVKDIINLEDVPDGITANTFLEAVYLAYQEKDNENS